MQNFDVKRFVKFGLLVIVVVYCLGKGKTYLERWTHCPPPVTRTQQIAPGKNEPILIGAMVEPGQANFWRTRHSSSKHWYPYYLDFTSEAGEIEICAIPFSSNHQKDRQEIQDKAEQFSKGQAVSGTIAEVSGISGRMYFGSPYRMWDRSKVGRYAILLRSKSKTKVTLDVHYSR